MVKLIGLFAFKTAGRITETLTCTKEMFVVDEDQGFLLSGQVELKLAWSLMAFNGLRPGEVLDLFGQDFDLKYEKLILLPKNHENITTTFPYTN